MKNKALTVLAVVSLLLVQVNVANAAGKYKWWTTSATGNWFQNGIYCYSPASDEFVGQKFSFAYELGQSKKFVSLGTGLSTAGSTLVDQQGNLLPAGATVDDNGQWTDAAGNTIDTMQACHDPKAIAYISPHTPSEGGAYNIKFTAYAKNGSIAWVETEKMLATYTGIESGSNFFTNPPAIYFDAVTTANLQPLGYLGAIKAYTSSGGPRNACLILYDIAIQDGKKDSSINASQLISSAQMGGFGADVKNVVGNLAIPTAIKCAPWIADYLW